MGRNTEKGDRRGDDTDALQRKVKSLQRQLKREKEWEATFHEFFDNAPVGKYMTDLKGKLLRVNQVFSDMLGRSLAEMKNLSLDDVTHPTDLAAGADGIRAMLAGEQDTVVTERRYAHKDGHYVWTEARTRLQRNEAGKPLYFLAHIEDISRIKRTIQSLEETQRLARLGSWEWDSQQDKIQGSAEFYRLFECEPTDIARFEDFSARLHPDDLERVERDVNDAMTRNRIYDTEYRIKRKDGGWREIAARGQVVLDERGNSIGLIGTCIDVTERNAVEKRLNEAEHRARTFLAGTQDLVTVVDSQGRFVYVNDASRRFFGAEPAALIGREAFDFTHPDDVAATKTRFEQWQRDKVRAASFENRQVSADGTVRDMLWTIMPQYGEDGGATETWSIARDITDRKVIEAAAVEELATLKAVFDGFDDAIYVADPETYELLYANNAVKQNWGDDIIGKKCYVALQGLDAPCPFCTNDKIFGEYLGRAYTWEILNKLSNRWYRCVDKAIDWVDGRKVRFEIASDVTEAREAQEAIARSNELQIIMDAIPGLVFYKDAENRYLRVNKYVADAHNREKSEMEGVSCFDLYPREQAQAYLDDDLAVIASGEPRLNIDEPWDTDRGRRWVTTSKIPVIDASGKATGVIGVSMDVTERKLAEEAIEKQTRILNGVNRVFREALARNTEEEVAKIALRVAEEATGSKFGFIGEINDQGRLDTLGLSDPGWSVCRIEGTEATTLIKDMDIRGVWASVIQTGKSLMTNDPSAHPDSVGVPAGHPPLTSFLGVPFVRDGRPVGMIALANKEGGYTEDDRKTIEALSMSIYEVLMRKRAERLVAEQNRIKADRAEIADLMRGNLDTTSLCRNIITFLCKYLNASAGLIFLGDNDGSVHLAASYAYRRTGRDEGYRPGEGLVGQAVLERKDVVIRNVPDDYLRIESGLGDAKPRAILIKPIVRNHVVKAVLEIATLGELDPAKKQYLDDVSEGIAMAVESAQARAYQAKLLEESRQLAEELQAQQEELKTANEELEEQADRLRESEEKLKAQQEELQVTNEELEEKNELLERQKREVIDTRSEIEKKAEELALASKYKSEFLANMSHELRTPLNSLLLLAQSLSQNRESHLSESEVEAAKVIHSSGVDLLNLINEILDLAKIEAGRVDVQVSRVTTDELATAIKLGFGHMAREKGLALDIVIADDAPRELHSDRKRIDQIVKNLVSNAIKFTETGGVTVTFSSAPHAKDKAEMFAIAVKDTGIGIAPENHRIVFESFQQVDGGISRKYGGTGLGLSISREIAILLGGEIQLQSERGSGSTFTLYLPTKIEGGKKTVLRDTPHVEPAPVAEHPASAPTTEAAEVADDRKAIGEADNVILVIEDDAKFANVLLGKCHERGMKCLLAPTGEAGLELAKGFVPTGIILDIRLPGIDGWSVLAALKDDTRTRHIPVHVVSVEHRPVEAMRRGAIGHIAKPVSLEDLDEVFQKIRTTSETGEKRILLVEDNAEVRKSVVQLLGDGEVKVDEAATGAAALAALKANVYHCVVLDLGLPDMTGLEILQKAETAGIVLPPIVIHTASDLTATQEMELAEYAETIVLKDVRSRERLLDEVSLFLHHMVGAMPDRKRQIIRNLHETDTLLRGKQVLVVDDDMRTLFAVSKLLTDRGMKPVKAANGAEALKELESNPAIDIVLMDIMMPVMDGYEAMRRIRAMEKYRKLPVIALTAKAMKEDREKCIEAGANDYMTKPVDEERLVSLMRVWLYR